MASSIVFSGLASGIDSEAVISALTGVAKAPISRLEKQKSNYSAQSKKLSDFKTKLLALQNAAKALDTRGEAVSNKVTSSDEKLLKVQSSGSASTASYDVEVSSLAHAERTYSAAFSSDSERFLFGIGSLTIQVGADDPVEIQVDTNDTLASVATKINESDAEVSARVIKDGDSYRLQVTGARTGASNDVKFTEYAITLGIEEATPAQAATDASVLVDGYAFTSANNTITSAISGVTLEVVDEGSVQVQVEHDPDGLKTKLNTFVTAYNEVMKTLNSEFSYTGSTKGADSLNGDNTLRGLQGSLRQLVASVTENGASALTTLGAIGVSSQRDGTLSLDDTKYRAAAGSDYQGITTVLAGLTDGTGLMTKIASGLELYTGSSGSLRNKIDGLAERNRRIDTQIDSMQIRLDKYEATLRTQYAALEKTISGLQTQGNSLSSIISSISA